MEPRYISRLIACSRCGLGVHDDPAIRDGVTIRSVATGRVLEIVHEACLDGDEIARLDGEPEIDAPCVQCGSLTGHFDGCPKAWPPTGPSEPGGTSCWSGGAPL